MAVPPILGMAALIGAWHWQTRQQEALASWKQRARNCASMAESILVIRKQPKLVEDRVVDAQAFAGYLERAARKASMNQDRIKSIHPEYPRRLKNSPYVETITRTRLTRVTMSDVTRLIWNLQQEAPGLAIPELRVWVESTDAKTWEAELNLVALAYSPRSS